MVFVLISSTVLVWVHSIVWNHIFLFHGEQHDIQHPDDGEFEHVGLSVNQFTTTTTTKYVLRTVGMCILLIHYQNKINRSEWSSAIHFILLFPTNCFEWIWPRDEIQSRHPPFAFVKKRIVLLICQNQRNHVMRSPNKEEQLGRRQR